MNDEELSCKKKLARLEYHKNKVGFNDEEIAFLKNKFPDIDYRLLKTVYAIVYEKINEKSKITSLLLARISGEEDFGTLDWLINAYESNVIAEARERNESPIVTYAFLYDEIIRIIDSGGYKYKCYFISVNAEDLFAHALAAQKHNELQQYIAKQVETAKTEESLASFLKLAEIYSGKIGLNDETKDILKAKLANPGLSGVADTIKNVLAVNIIKKKGKYSELIQLSSLDIAETLAKRDNPLTLRQEALRELTKRFKWRLFSSSSSDSVVRSILLGVVRNESEDEALRDDIASRLGMESRVITSDAELRENERYIRETVEILAKQKNSAAVVGQLLNSIPLKQLERKSLLSYLSEKSNASNINSNTRAAIIFCLSQSISIDKEQVYESVIRILKEKEDALDDGTLQYMAAALHLKSNYKKNEIREKLADIDNKNKELLLIKVNSFDQN